MGGYKNMNEIQIYPSLLYLGQRPEMWILAPKMQIEAEHGNGSGGCREAAPWSFLLGELEESVGQVSQPVMDAWNLDTEERRGRAL